MKSMTGYGAAEGKAKGKVVRAQLSSVNSKRGLDLNISLPRSLEDQETFVREIIKAQVTRARVNVGLTVQDEGTPK
ncbi:MAG: YicC/YloC family endoribonuclease, partial [Verrucomicrobiota bacterium]